MCHASIEKMNGEPVIQIDGQPITPMAMTAFLEKPEYLRRLGEAGIRLFFVMANTDWLDPPGRLSDDGSGREEPGGFAKFCASMKMLLENVQTHMRLCVSVCTRRQSGWKRIRMTSCGTATAVPYPPSYSRRSIPRSFRECTRCAPTHGGRMPPRR